MLLKPTDNWYWRYCEKQQRVVLDMGEELMFLTHYPFKKLVPGAAQSRRFSVDDAALYYRYLDGLARVEMPAPVKVQTALNGIAAVNYHKPMMPQGWFFIEQPGNGMPPSEGMVAHMQAVSGEWGCFLLVECNQDTALCLLLDRDIRLNERKSLHQFDLIKVMNNRLQQSALAAELVRKAV